MRRACPLTNMECKYYDMPPPPELRSTQEHGCYEDTDHLISQRLAVDSLSRYIINRPENKQQICRAEHDEKNYREQTTGVDDYPMPDRETQLGIVMVDIASGRHVPRRVRKALKQGQEQVAERRGEVISQFWSQLEERRA